MEILIKRVVLSEDATATVEASGHKIFSLFNAYLSKVMTFAKNVDSKSLGDVLPHFFLGGGAQRRVNLSERHLLLNGNFNQ